MKNQKSLFIFLEAVNNLTSKTPDYFFLAACEGGIGEGEELIWIQPSAIPEGHLPSYQLDQYRTKMFLLNANFEGQLREEIGRLSEGEETGKVKIYQVSSYEHMEAMGMSGKLLHLHGQLNFNIGRKPMQRKPGTGASSGYRSQGGYIPAFGQHSSAELVAAK